MLNNLRESLNSVSISLANADAVASSLASTVSSVVITCDKESNELILSYGNDTLENKI